MSGVLHSDRGMIVAAGLAVYGTLVTETDPRSLWPLLEDFFGVVVSPVLAAALAIFIFSAMTGRWLRPPLLLLGGALALAGVTALTLPLNVYLQLRAVATARAYPERVAPLLEQYRKEHGGYPPTLNSLPARPQIPRLLRSPDAYLAYGGHYIFALRYFDGGAEYDGKSHAWNYPPHDCTWWPEFPPLLMPKPAR